MRRPKTKREQMLTRIVSGGQTGADRGGIDAAIHCKLPHGGWCPKGRRAEDGFIPEIYDLRESNSSDYKVRTEANVVDSDCTIIFTDGALQGGSLLTAEFAKKHRKPCLHIDISASNREQAVERIVHWLREQCPAECVLNVAGQRASKSPNIARVVRAWMIDVISKANGKLFYPISDQPDDEGSADASPAEQVTPDEVPHLERKEIALYHPKTIDEAVQIVIDALPPAQRAQARGSADRDEFANGKHFGLVLGIRNAMIHQNSNRIDLMADFQRGCREGRWAGPAEPDNVSGVIVRLVWDRLHR